ncbi:sensor histidine kinase [Fodinibius halophilus]|uniref:histidine kinase n=1 Tax=Fodinibius halophilus TaxID=1736908 RepID=A0A6M1TG42_9BACT|nr:histidine kinase dimerization/phosphoacceptor domain -containing protein [Fodinibius halophilus]NGP87610.1 PAS domain S-box protein [Fodinibius halophilus]
MKLKTRLNIIAACSVGVILLTFGLLWHSKSQLNSQIESLNRLNEFKNTASNVEVVVSAYLAHGKARHLKSWDKLYRELRLKVDSTQDLPRRKAMKNYMGSVKDAFELIREIKENPEQYSNEQRKEELLERAEGRIRADIQMFQSIAYNVINNLQDDIQYQQKYQFFLLQLLLVPSVFIIAFLIFRFRRRLNYSLDILLKETKQIANGNLAGAIELEGEDEHARLAEEFNIMTTRLQKKIEELKESRRKIDQSRKRWEKLVEQDPNLIMIHIDGIVQFVNPGGVNLVGAESAEEVEGLNIYDLVKESQLEKAHARVSQVQESKEKVSPTIYEITSLDGKERYLLLESMPIKYDGRDATQTVGLDITERVRYEEEMKKSLEEKTVLLKEIHHRIKNNLAVISGLMELQTMQTDDVHFTSKLQASQLRIQSIASIHELLYQSENFSDLEFHTQLTKLVDTIKATLEADVPIVINYDLDHVVVNVNRAIPAALIVNELVSNAIEHAFEDAEYAKIDIILRERGSQITLEVSDNGQGIPRDLDMKHPDTLGLKLINILSKQLEGDIDYYSDHEGTTFVLSFENIATKGIGSHHLN